MFYARTYTAGQGYQYSETNQLILNFKIRYDDIKRNPQRRQYKQRAIQQFAKEVTALLRDQLDPSLSLILVPIPPSKERSHPEYDDRVEQVVKAVAANIHTVSWLPLLQVTTSMESYHSRSAGRNPEDIYAVLQLDEASAKYCQPNSIIALVDDVLTSGAHFTAARRRIQERFPDTTVIGIFWAKAVSYGVSSET
uniref:ComF family protein n=1 Tax=Oscillatoriales cyanobacterium SpSt-418 TaxID=2282169 RepID=A0A7C3PIQ3_9CYAN